MFHLVDPHGQLMSRWLTALILLKLACGIFHRSDHANNLSVTPSHNIQPPCHLWEGILAPPSTRGLLTWTVIAILSSSWTFHCLFGHIWEPATLAPPELSFACIQGQCIRVAVALVVAVFLLKRHLCYPSFFLINETASLTFSSGINEGTSLMLVMAWTTIWSKPSVL